MVYAAYFANVLFVIKAVNDRARAEEKYCFEKGMCADMEEC